MFLFGSTGVTNNSKSKKRKEVRGLSLRLMSYFHRLYKFYYNGKDYSKKENREIPTLSKIYLTKEINTGLLQLYNTQGNKYNGNKSGFGS